MTFEQLWALMGTLLVGFTLVAKSLTTQWDNIVAGEWEKFGKWLMIMVVAQIFTFVIVKADFIDVEALKNMNGYALFALGFGLGLGGTGAYDGIKGQLDKRSFKGEQIQAKLIKTKNLDEDGNNIAGIKEVKK